MRFIVGGIEQKTVDVRSIRIDQDINQGFLSSVADLREQKKIIEDRSDIFDVFLIDDANAKVEIFGEIEQIARATGHSEFSYQIIKKNDAIKKADAGADEDSADKYLESIAPLGDKHSIFLTMKMVGTYENLAHFLKKMEGFVYENDILALDVSAIDAKDTRGARRFGATTPEESIDQRVNLVNADLTIALYLDSLVMSAESDALSDGGGGADVDDDEEDGSVEEVSS